MKSIFGPAGRGSANEISRMLTHQLPHLISHVGAIGRDPVLYCHVATRALVLGVLRIESPRASFRLKLQEGRSAAPRGSRRGNPFFIQYDIFKNAGSSFDWALNQAFGESTQQLDSDDPDAFVTRSTIVRDASRHPEIKAISTHQAAPPPPRILVRRVLTSIQIRDLIARIRSIYAFERWQSVDSIEVKKARDLDLRHYVEWRLEFTPRLFCNFQLHFLRRQGERSVERNEFDMRFHQVADALLTRRLVDQGAEVSLRRAYRDARTKRRSRPARHAARL